MAFFFDWDWQAAEKHYLRSFALDPNNGAEGRESYAHLFSCLGQHEKALAEAKRAREFDPLNLRASALEGQFLYWAQRYDESLDSLNKTIDLEPNFWLFL